LHPSAALAQSADCVGEEIPVERRFLERDHTVDLRDPANRFGIVPVAGDRDLKENQRHFRRGREILEKTHFQLPIDFAPGKQQRRENHDGVDRQMLELAEQRDRFLRRLRRNGSDMDPTRLPRDVTGDAIHAPFLFVGQHRSFADARARNQARYAAPAHQVRRESLQASKIHGSRIIERRDVRHE
jgi:hypothetical protein